MVTDVVPGVNRFAVGDEVYGMPMFPRPAGAYAEFAAAPSRGNWPENPARWTMCTRRHCRWPG